MVDKQFRGDGTSVGFILVTLLSGTAETYIRDMLAVLFPNSVLFSEKNFWITAVVDFLLVCVPIGANITLTNIQCPHILLCTFIILTAIFLITVSSHWDTLPQNMNELRRLRMCERRITVTYVRSFVNIIASFCILAVDFPIFPRYEIKSKHYGTTFMDGGVGTYVMAGSMVSPRSRDKPLSVRQEMTEAIIMAVLGLCRLLLVTWTGYGVSEMEYGVHWNFFFTLAFIKVFSTVLLTTVPHHVIPFLGPIITLLYQYFLSIPSVYRYVMFGAEGHFSRTNFIDSNREGIFSAIGYLALYFYGIEFGRLLMKRRETLVEWCGVFCTCVALTGGSWVLFTVAATFFDYPSRQMANAAYIFFVLILVGGTATVSLFLEIATTFLCLTVRGNIKGITPDNTEGPLHRAVNYNGLFYFLVANLLTGAINLLLDTRGYSARMSYFIITTYMFFLSTSFLYLERKKINLKASIVNMCSRTNGRNFEKYPSAY